MGKEEISREVVLRQKMNKLLSKAEREYIRGGSDVMVREDGRKQNDLRAVLIEREVIPHVNGSAHVKIGDSLEVLCSVKTDVIEPRAGAPSEGQLVFTTEISSACSAISVHMDERKLTMIGAEISHHLQSFYMGSDSLNLTSMGIIDGRFCWAIHVDLVVLQCDGYPLDACSVAAREALLCTKLPKLQMKMGDSGQPENFDVEGDMSSAVGLSTNDLPVCLTMAKVGAGFLSDVSLNEYLSADCVYTVALDKKGQFCGVAKIAGSALPADQVFTMLQFGQAVHQEVESVLVT